MKLQYGMENFVAYISLTSEEKEIYKNNILTCLSSLKSTFFINTILDKQDDLHSNKLNMKNYCMQNSEKENYLPKTHHALKRKEKKINDKFIRCKISVELRENCVLYIKKMIELRHIIDEVNREFDFNAPYTNVKIYDFYAGDGRNELFSKTTDGIQTSYIDYLKSLLKKKTYIKIVIGKVSPSAIYSYKRLGDYVDKSKEKLKLEIKYIRRSLYSFNSLIFILFSTKNKQFILYFEPETNWAVYQQVSNKPSEFISTFWKLLNARFDNHFLVDALHPDKGINFRDSLSPIFLMNTIEAIGKKLNSILNNNKYNEDVRREIKSLIMKINAINISNPENSNIASMLYFMTKYIEHLLSNTSEFENKQYQTTVDMISTLGKTGILGSLRGKISALDNSFINTFTEKEYYSVDNLTEKLHNTKINEIDTLPALVSDFPWNNKETVISSFTKILSDDHILIKILLECNQITLTNKKSEQSIQKLANKFYMLLYKTYQIQPPSGSMVASYIEE